VERGDAEALLDPRAARHSHTRHQIVACGIHVGTQHIDALATAQPSILKQLGEEHVLDELLTQGVERPPISGKRS
jgi:hypothetical protein